MFLLVAVINNDELLDELITGWIDLGVTGATVIETSGALQLVSRHIPVFAGFRSLTSGGESHNRTIFTAIEGDDLLNQAISFLEEICRAVGQPSQGVYFVTPLTKFGRLGVPRIDSS